MQHRLSVSTELLETIPRFLWPNKLNQLHLVELVLPNQTSNIAPMRTCFSAEAGCGGAVANGEFRLVESLVPIEVGQRHLGGRCQVEVEIFDVKQIVGEFRKLTSAKERGRVDQVGWDDLGVTVLAGVLIEHVGDQCTLERRALPAKDRETARRDLGCALEINHSELRAEVPVSLGLEVEIRLFAPGPLDPVGIFIGADRYALVEKIGNLELELSEFGLEAFGAGFEALDLLTERGHLRLQLFGLVLTTSLVQTADLFRTGIPTCFERLDLNQHLPPRSVDLEQTIERRLGMALGKHGTDPLRVIAEEFAGEHSHSFGEDYSSSTDSNTPVCHPKTHPG